jgi:hypothetical protein
MTTMTGSALFQSANARPLLNGIVLLALAACADDPASQCVCTEEFRVFSVAVLDDASQPVSDAQLTVTNLRTGRDLTSGWLGQLVPGSYVIADDGMLDEFSSDGDPVRVTGQAAAGSFTTVFVFAPDACRCHLQRVAGPDTVVIGEPPAR